MTLPPYPDEIKREGAYKLYKGRRYAVYDDGASADVAHNADLAEYWEAVARLAVEALEKTRSQRLHPELWPPESNHWSVIVSNVLAEIGELPPP